MGRGVQTGCVSRNVQNDCRNGDRISYEQESTFQTQNENDDTFSGDHTGAADLRRHSIHGIRIL